jgi:AcrR family transcriptional regulator
MRYDRLLTFYGRSAQFDNSHFGDARFMSQKNAATPRKLPRQERAQATVEAILTATTHILTESGYDQFTTNRVAERAGVSIGSLYQYFPNKDALIFALATHHADAMVQLVQHHLTGLDDRPIAEVIQRIVKAALAAHAVNPQLHRVLNEQVPRSETMRQAAEAQMAGMLRSFLERHQAQLKPDNLDLTVFIIGRTIESLTHHAVLDHPELLHDGKLEREITTLLLTYLVQN